MENKNGLIYDCSLKDLQLVLKELNEPVYRANQVWEGLYKHNYSKIENFSNIPGTLRNKLGELFSFSNLTLVESLVSKDQKTHKNLFELPDGNRIETVLMAYDKRNSVCISTQAGCAMDCIFCATGQLGFNRNLTSGEIIEQVLFFARELKNDGQRLTNIVVMGMGEPFINYEATIQAIDRLNDPTGFNFGERRFTISTVGIIPMIDKFAAEKRQINLAVSLHAANNELRSKLIPTNKRYPLDDLIQSCINYTNITKRRITFE
jgi:23S rRNA (adenine2503-C2)-methyltransferase